VTSGVVLSARLLETYGVECSGQALIEECGDNPSLVVMVGCLERRGLRARIVSIVRSDLACLGVTLVELRDRSVALLRSGRGRRCCLELASGETLRGIEQVESVLGGRALEIDAAWPESGSALGRCVRMCFDEPRLRGALTLLAATLLFTGAIGFVQPAVVSQIVDRAIPEGTKRLLAVLAGGLALLAVISALAANASNRAAQYLEKRAAVAAHGGIFSHYLALPLAQLQRQSAGQASQLLGSVPAIVRGTLHSAIDAGIDVFLAAGYLLWILRLSPLLAALLLVLHLALAALLIPSARKVGLRQDQLQTKSGAQSDHLLELIERIGTLRAEGAVDWATARWRRALRDTQQHELSLEMARSVITELVGAAQRLTVGGAVLWAAHSALSGAGSLGELFVVVALATGASAALTRLVALGSRLLATRAQLARVDEVLRQSTVQVARAQPRPYRGLRPEHGIVIDGLWFRYSAATRWVIQDFSVSFPAGQISVLRWPSGSGKSTLLRLIAGLYTPDSGTISINGLDPRAARQLVTYIPQNCPLFAGSLLHNLELLSGATNVRIEEAAAATGLLSLTQHWPMGLETIVSAGGSNLSSGQRQLVILTAAIASHRPVLLLDEATTHIDSILRSLLQHGSLLRGRTVVNVTHFESSSS
jgi:ATP-binding cassette, subfamily B, bacterial